MALDGAFLHTIKSEIETVISSRVDKIYQPSKEEIVIVLRFRGGTKKLLISAGANSPRVHFTDIALENPKSPPMFCMLLRKHLNAGKLLSITQVELDRILQFNFEATNELGDIAELTLSVEIMGRHSNIVLVRKDGTVIDSIKRISLEMSSVRRVLPGVAYELPPLQDKINLLENDFETIYARLQNARNDELSKALLAVLQGVSPIFCREVMHFVARGEDIYKDDLTEEQVERLRYFLSDVKNKLTNNTPQFTTVSETDGRPKDFSFINITQYGTYMLTKQFETAGELLDNFYSERDRIVRMKVRSSGILKLLVNTNERLHRKLELQRSELLQCGEREILKIKGDLINANLYRLEKGMTGQTLENFYDNNAPIEIKLDPALTPSQNSQRYYKNYRRAVTAEKKLAELIASAEQEILYIDTIFDAVSRTTGESELLEIREELVEQGYLRRQKAKNKPTRPAPPKKYLSSDGFAILCGRNNKQNDKLTLKDSRKHDIWCHTHDIPGSHVIIVTEGKDVPQNTILEACTIAGYNSKARTSAQVPVDYTEVKNVKKPNGAKPGMVIFEDNKTMFVTPTEDFVTNLEA